MKHRIIILFALASFPAMAFSSSCLLHDDASEICHFAESGLHLGGSKITDTNIPSNRGSVKAGGLLSFSYGLSANVSDIAEIRISLGFKSDDTFDFEYNTGFFVYTSELMLLTKNEKINIGLGASYYFQPEFNSTFDIEYDNSNGWLFEIDYNISSFSYVGLKRSIIRYEEKVPGNGTIDGSSFAIIIGMRF